MRTAASAGPRRSSLVILLVSAAAMLATSPAIPQLVGHVRGEVGLGGGETVTRQVRLHLEPDGAAGATDGSVSVGFVAANGLDDGYGIGTSLSIAPEGAPTDAPAVSAPIPLERCVDGCDLTYIVTIVGSPDVLPGSTMRFDVDGLVRYQGFSSGDRDPSLMQLDVDGRASGPPPALWGVVAGLLAIALGIAAAPRVLGRLPASRRRWPALALAGLPLAILGSLILTRAVDLVGYLASSAVTVDASIVFYILDPWSTALLVVLAWGVIRGIGRWPLDGGWSLGLGAVALLGLGGLWLALVSTDGSIFQPWLYGAAAAAMGFLGGIVVGGAWRTDTVAANDRGWASAAVLSHGILIAGFGFLSVQWLYDPFGGSPIALVLLVPAALLSLALRRWFSGSRRWLILLDALILAIGVLGSWLWLGGSYPRVGSSQAFGLDDLGVVVATGAAAVGLITAFHVLRRPSASARENEGVISPTGPPVVGPATT